MKNNVRFLKDTLGWGALLWLFGYILGIVLFMLVPQTAIGWIITPIASALTVWILMTKISSESFGYFLVIGLIWTVLAMVLDYIFIVKTFKPIDGYYKLDVYLYYVLMFLLPIIVGLQKERART